MSSSSKFIQVKLSAYHNSTLDRVASEIVSMVLKVGGVMKGPINMPTKTKRFLVIRGPHIDKKSREAFFQSIHTRLIIIKSDPAVMQEIKNINIPNDIGVELKMI